MTMQKIFYSSPAHFKTFARQNRVIYAALTVDHAYCACSLGIARLQEYGGRRAKRLLIRGGSSVKIPVLVAREQLILSITMSIQAIIRVSEQISNSE